MEREEAGDGDDTWPPKRKVVEKVIPKSSRKSNQQDGTNTDLSKKTEEKGGKDVPKGGTKTNGPNAGTGKNAARNKKKKGKEKRKKLVKNFAANLSQQVPKLLDAVQDRLLKYDLDVRQYQPDHVCWRTEALEEYSE